MADMALRLDNIVKVHGYSSVDDFMRVNHHAKADYADYSKRLKAWADKYGIKVVKQEFDRRKRLYKNMNEQNHSR